MMSSQGHDENSQSQNQHPGSQILKAKKPKISQELNNSHKPTSKISPSKSPFKCQSGESTSQHKLFAPFLSKSLHIMKAETGFGPGAVSYNEKHNIIIACPHNKTMVFFNATTLLPLEGLKPKKLESHVVKMAFCEDSETYLLGCQGGEIYAYNISGHLLQKLPKQASSYILAMTFLHSEYYAFSAVLSGQLSLGNLEDGKTRACYFMKERSVFLCNLPKRRLLISSLWNGSLVVYRTNQLPRLPIIEAGQGCSGEYTEIHNITIGKKEFIVTNGRDKTIRIWHFIKGKMRLLRVIRLKERIQSMVYLENFKMLAMVENSGGVKFLSLPAGKIEKTLGLKLTSCVKVFLMKDKNAIGVASSSENVIRIVQLHGGESVDVFGCLL